MLCNSIDAAHSAADVVMINLILYNELNYNENFTLFPALLNFIYCGILTYIRIS